MLKPLVLKFCPGLSPYLKDIAETQVPGKLKPIVDPSLPFTLPLVIFNQQLSIILK